MTVLADHGAPLGVPTCRAFNSAATDRADIPANSERIGAMGSASSRAPACRAQVLPHLTSTGGTYPGRMPPSHP